MQLLIPALALLLTVMVAARPAWHELSSDYTFARYVQDFGKAYSSKEEHELREKLFMEELDRVMKHNAQPGVLFRRGVNRMSDWTEAEKKRLRGARAPRNGLESSIMEGEKVVDLGTIPLPRSLDYRTYRPPVLTAVKDQATCGNCWAHAVTETVESSYALKTGELFVLSTQQVSSCTPQYGGCFGCNGSFPSLGYKYLSGNALTEEWLYPFVAADGNCPQCRENPLDNYRDGQGSIQSYVNVSTYVSVRGNNPLATMQALVSLGPLSVLVDAGDWSSYEAGIHDSCSRQASLVLDHAVQLVGYGTEGGIDYWIVRNSWAASWGEEGYIRLRRSSNPDCLVDDGASTIANCNGDSPGTVVACGECGVLFNPQFAVTTLFQPPSSS